MRPCNQCRQPVENNVQVCQDCRTWNQEHSIPDESPKEYPPPYESDRDLRRDHSYAILMGIFCTVIAALFALIGLAANGMNGLTIGTLIGVALGAVLFTLMIRM